MKGRDQFLLRSDFSLPKLEQLQQDAKSRMCASFAGAPSERLIKETRRDLRRNNSRNALCTLLRKRWLDNSNELEALVAASDRSCVGFVSCREMEFAFEKAGLHLLMEDLDHVFDKVDRRRGSFPVSVIEDDFGTGLLLSERERRKRRRNAPIGQQVVCIQLVDMDAIGYFQPSEVEVEGRLRPEEVVALLQKRWSRFFIKRKASFDWDAPDDDGGHAHEAAAAPPPSSIAAADLEEIAKKGAQRLSPVPGDHDAAQKKWRENRSKRKGHGGRHVAVAQLQLAKPQQEQPPSQEQQAKPKKKKRPRSKIDIEVDRRCKALISEAMARSKNARGAGGAESTEGLLPPVATAVAATRPRPTSKMLKEVKAAQQLEMLWALRQHVDVLDVDTLMAKHDRQFHQFANPENSQKAAAPLAAGAVVRMHARLKK
jgi:hypothetical protein